MIEVYKYLHGKYDVDASFLALADNSNRGHNLKLKKQYSRLKLRHDFFSIRVVEYWNSLPETVAAAPSLNTFKNRLDKHWREFLYSLDPPRISTHYSYDEVLDSDDEEQSTGH